MCTVSIHELPCIPASIVNAATLCKWPVMYREAKCTSQQNILIKIRSSYLLRS